MKILEVAMSGTVGTARMGPVSTDICELSNCFVRRGHEVVVADMRSGEPRSLLDPDVRVLEHDGTPEGLVESPDRGTLRNVLLRWRSSYAYVRDVTAGFDVSTTDIVHAHHPIAAFILQRLHGIRCAYTAHTPVWSLNGRGGSRSDDGASAARTSLGGRFRIWIETDTIRRSRLTIGLGDYLKAAVSDANVETIPNGLDLDAWQPVEKAAVRPALGIRETDFLVVFVGRLSHIKGVDVLVAAVEKLAPALPNLKVLVIGALSGLFDVRDERVGAYARTVIDAARGLPMEFLGFINNREARFRQYLASADVFVVPSRREPFGLVVLEALAMGTPVIGSATGGIVDTVSPDVGYLFPPGDVSALAECIRDVHDHPARSRDMRAAARARVALHYSWEDIADRYLAAFARSISA